MRYGHSSLLALALLCACGPAAQTGVYATQPQLLFVDGGGAGERPLRSGQIFALVLELQQPAHVYVIQRRGDVLVDVYPGIGVPDAELSRGEVRLPGPDAWMRVPQFDRQSRMCVLLSPQPIPPDLRHCPTARSRKKSPQPIQSFMLPQVRS